MQIVYIPGVWDLLHVGHLIVLKNARALGDRLIVGVPSDPVVMQDKGSLPIVSCPDRITMLESLSCVDLAIPYYTLEFLTHLNMVRPDILIVGETWGNKLRHTQAEEWTSANNCRVIKLPYHRDESTTGIKQRVWERRSEK